MSLEFWEWVTKFPKSHATLVWCDLAALIKSWQSQVSAAGCNKNQNTWKKWTEILPFIIFSWTRSKQQPDCLLHVSALIPYIRTHFVGNVKGWNSESGCVKSLTSTFFFRNHLNQKPAVVQDRDAQSHSFTNSEWESSQSKRAIFGSGLPPPPAL